MNLKQKNKGSRIAFIFLISFGLLSSQVDSLSGYIHNAENAFLQNDISLAADYYVKALELQISSNLDKDEIDNRLKVIELLALCLQQIGRCDLASQYLRPLLTPESNKASVSNTIQELIRCNNANGTHIDAQLQHDILAYMSLAEIDEDAQNQLTVFLKGEYTDDQDLSDFFLLLEYGFIPAAISLEKEKEANKIVIERTWIAVGASFLVLAMGFFLFTTNRRKEHLIRENVALLTGKEKETNRLSVDLHDILGYKIVELKDQVKRINSSPNMSLDNVSKGLDELHESMRYIVQSNLTPESLKFGLGPALETLFNRVNKLGVVQFSLYKHGLSERLNEEKEKHIFYIIQELVNNVIKHSKGSKASFEISKLIDEVSILAEDNGIGYTPSVDTLKTVKSRVGYLNGKVIEESEIDKGSTVIITIPV